MSSSVKLAKTAVVMLFVVSAILNGFATLVSVYQSGDKTPSIASAWSLNRDLSDDATKVMKGMAERRSGGSSRMPSGMGGMGGGRGGGMRGNGRDAEEMQEMREVMNKAIEAPARLSITQADGDVTFTDDDGRSKTFAANNKKERHQFENRTVETKTRWADGRLSQRDVARGWDEVDGDLLARQGRGTASRRRKVRELAPAAAAHTRARLRRHVHSHGTVTLILTTAR